jgi:hypothetical protein
MLNFKMPFFFNLHNENFEDAEKCLINNFKLISDKNYIIHYSFGTAVITCKKNAIVFLIKMYDKYIKNEIIPTPLLNTSSVMDRCQNSTLILPNDVELACYHRREDIAEFLLENADWGKDSKTVLSKLFAKSMIFKVIKDWVNGVHPVQLRRKEVESVEKFGDVYIPEVNDIINGYM